MLYTLTVGHTDVKWLCMCLLSALCAVLSKEQGITVVAVCVVYDVLYCVKVRDYMYVCIMKQGDTVMEFEWTYMYTIYGIFCAY